MEFLDTVLPHLLLWLMRVSGVLFVLLGLVGLTEGLEGRRISIPSKPVPPKGNPTLPAYTFTPGVSMVASWGRGNHFVPPEVSDPELINGVMTGSGGRHGVVESGLAPPC